MKGSRDMSASVNAAWTARDLGVVWHPCTQMKDHEHLPMIPIRRAQGVWLEDFEGRRYLDGISSWWTNLFGHCNAHIAGAIAKQATTLEHVLLAGFTHEPAIRLAEGLRELTPTGLDRCFYTDNGSSAVEAALKMSFHYWRNVGQSRKRRFVCLANSYHGETVGALSVGDVPLYRETYRPLLWDVITVPSPDCYERQLDETCEQVAVRQFAHMERALAEHGEDICAVIVEPLVQCAGQMRMYHPIYLKLLRDACDRYDVHLIADEIAVGFGRTGSLFACEQAGISPDLMCLSKGISGGFMTLAAVMSTEKIYQAFYDEYVSLRAFLHSHSYSGNALACAAGVATLELFKASDVLGENRWRADAMARLTAPLREHPHVAEVRQQGMIVAVEMVRDARSRAPYDWRERRGVRAYQYALEHGVLLRPLSNVLYLMPPYVISMEEIERMTMVLRAAIDHATTN